MREHGFNRGPEVEKYQRAGGGRPGDAWCSWFVSWCLRTQGVACRAFGAAKSWFDQAHTIWRYGAGKTPQPGDLNGYTWGADHVCHVELVKSWPPGVSMEAIGGNTHGHGLSREGDGVFLNWRDKRQIAFVADVIDNPRYTHGE